MSKKIDDITLRLEQTGVIYSPKAKSSENIESPSVAAVNFWEKYTIQSQLSVGGMGQVLHAKQKSLNRDVAIKIINAPGDEEAVQRFFLEASLTAKLQHPNTIRIFDFGQTDDGTMFLVMELLNGKSIKQIVKENNKMDVELAFKIASQICGSLSEAHRLNLIHRDLKPTNIVVTEHPETGTFSKLIDFGLVKDMENSGELSLSGVILGSPMYMSPEQIESNNIDHRVDIYGLGLTLYYMLAGKRPYPQTDLASVLRAQTSSYPTPLSEIRPDLSAYPYLQWIVDTAIQKSPDKRFQSANQMKRVIDLALQAYQQNIVVSFRMVDGDIQFNDEITNISSGLARDIGKDKSTLILQLILAALVCLIGVLLYPIVFSNSTEQQVAEKTVESTTVSTTTITLTTEPNGADVFSDEIQLGTTPFVLQIPMGTEKKVLLKKEGYVGQMVLLAPENISPMIILKPIGE